MATSRSFAITFAPFCVSVAAAEPLFVIVVFGIARFRLASCVACSIYNLINVFMRFLVCMWRFIFGASSTLAHWLVRVALRSLLVCVVSNGDIDGHNECLGILRT